MIVRKSGWNSHRFVELGVEDFKKLKIIEGDPLLIQGRRSLPAIAKLGSPHTVKKGEVAVGLNLQNSLLAANGDEVKVSRMKAEDATVLKFVISLGRKPEDDCPSFMMMDGDDLIGAKAILLARMALMNTVVRTGDTVSVVPLEKDALEKLPVDAVSFPDTFRTLLEGTIHFKIVETKPKGAVFIKKDTQCYEVDIKHRLRSESKVTFDMVGGLTKIKNDLKSSVELPITRPELFKDMGIRPTRGILLFGPPGCGKTMLAKAVCNELNAEFVYVRGGEVYNPFFGASEQKVREMFSYARSFARSVIFWDEFDAVGSTRNTAGHNSRLYDTILNSLLVEMDGIDSNDSVVVIAATNKMDVLDPALLRPGRFDKVINIPLPDKESRREIIDIYLKDKPVKGRLDTISLIEKTHGFTGADIENIVRLSVLKAMEDNEASPILEPRHIKSVMDEAKPSLTEDQVKYYSEMFNKSGAPGGGVMFR